MATKMTLRMPVHLAARLRAQSETEGRSINETAVRVLLRGLGETEPDEWWRELGDLVEEPPTERFDPDELARLRTPVGLDVARGIMEELDWSRGEA